MTTAIEFGERHGSCSEAMEARRALGPAATQADWWRVCQRADWLIWQLERVGQAADNPALERALDRIRARAIRRAQRALRGERAEWATAWRRWARRWLSGEDRSRAAAWAAARAAAWAAWAAARAAAWAAARAAAWAAARAAAWAAARAADRAADRAAAVAAAEVAARAAAWAAAVAAGAAAEVAEMRLQAQDIHREIPEWNETWEEDR